MFGFTTFGYEGFGETPVAPLGPVQVVSPLALFISSIPFDAAKLNTQNSIDIMPFSNLQTTEPERVWRAGGHTPRLLIQFQTPVAVNAVAIMAHNAYPDATWRVQGGVTQNSVSGIDAPSVDSAFASMWPPSGKADIGLAHESSLMVFPNTAAFIWWSIEINDPSNPDPFEAGRVMADSAVRINVGGQVSIQVSTKGDQRIGDFNRIFGDVRGPNGRKIMVPVNALTQLDLRKYILPYQLKHGIVKDFYFCANPTYDDDFGMFSMQCIFGDMVALQRQLQYQAVGATWSGNLDLLEQT